MIDGLPPPPEPRHDPHIVYVDECYRVTFVYDEGGGRASLWLERNHGSDALGRMAWKLLGDEDTMHLGRLAERMARRLLELQNAVSNLRASMAMEESE